ncbi:Galactoside-binding lectin [Popillia japonica]|uniref:Galectin n=1 Tax=Popillia japonica TaxID=7064 RepID=A0AAW1NAX6_POPJA
MEQTYNWPLGSGFAPGTMLRLRGTIPNGGKVFNINFQTKHDYNTSDIIFHISIRANENLVVMNTKDGGKWMTEQLRANENLVVMNTKDGGKWMTEQRASTSAIAPGREFEILIACEQKQFRVSVNGFHLADFAMRRAHTLITALSIIGEVNVGGMSFESSRPVPPKPHPHGGGFGGPFPFPR